MIASAAQFIPRYSNIVPDIEGARTFVSKWAGEITLGKCLFDDAKENKWNDTDIAESVNVPVMMVHGDLDDVIPVQSAKEMFDKIKVHKKQFRVIIDGDHRLNDQIKDI